MTEKERMIAGKLYRPLDNELRACFTRSRKLLREFNLSEANDFGYRKKIIQNLFESTGENLHIEPTFRCDYGMNISVGENFYANYGCVIIDVCKVKIGDNVMLGPNVGIYTAGHPIDAEVRNSGLEFGKPITIGDNVWIGGSSVVNPGVSIGDCVVIGSGSVVTKDIPDNVIAVGNPCRVLRPITEDDKKYWRAERDRYYAETEDMSK